VTKPIGICADDFGLEAGVNEGILQLVAQGRLSAVSCLTQGASFRQDSAKLASMDVDIGLHLNFTEALTGSDIVQPVVKLILQAYSHALSIDRVRAQINQQFDLFEEHVGRSPEFVDGHEHVHQLPVIREALVTVVKNRYPKQALWLRSTRPARLSPTLPAAQRVKAHLIAALGSRALRSSARRMGFSMNTDFAGVYDFTKAHPPYLQMLRDWLSQATTGSLLMSHPAAYVLATDRYGSDRITEYQVLGSEALATLLAELDLKITRLSGLNLAA